MIFGLSIKNWCFALCGSLEYKQISSISGWWFTRLNDEFVFSDPKLSVINILYGWSGVVGPFGLCTFMFSFVTSSKFYCIVLFCLYRFIMLLHLISFFSLTRTLLVPYVYVFIKSIDCVVLPSFYLKPISLVFLVKTLCCF